MIIPAKKMISLLPLVRKINKKVTISKGWANYYFYFLGREALLDSLIRLGVKPGESIVIPAYICNSTIDPLKEFGFNICFIDVNKNMSIDCDELTKLHFSVFPRAILIVHYFGIVQDLDRLFNICRERNILIIEDFAHSFLSLEGNNDTKMKGDAAIYSLRKILPVNNGGVLRFKDSKNNSNFRNIFKDSFSFGDFIFIIKSAVFKLVVYMQLFNIYTEKVDSIKNNIYLFKNNSSNKSFSRPSLTVLSKVTAIFLSDETYLNMVRCSHRNNYINLAHNLKKNNIFCFKSQIRYGAVPQALPITNPTLFDEVKQLRKKGIGAYKWPGKELPSQVIDCSKYPNANYFNKHLTILPIHSSITNSQIISISDIYRSIREKNDNKEIKK
jgi:perosamine synthetase